MFGFNLSFIRADITQFSDLWTWTGSALLNCYMKINLTFKPGSMTNVTISYEIHYELDGSGNPEKVTTSSFSTGLSF